MVPIVCGIPIQGDGFIGKQTVGTGFFVSRDGSLLRASHVLEGMSKIQDPRGKCSPVIYLPVGGWNGRQRGMPVRVLDFASCVTSSEADVAICKLTINPFTDSQLKSQVKVLKIVSSAG